MDIQPFFAVARLTVKPSLVSPPMLGCPSANPDWSEIE